jgi:hypothetical protein
VPKLNPTQRQILKRYEKTCIKLGYSRPETNTRVKRYVEAMRDANLQVPTPREETIRDAIYADRRAERELRFFIRQGHSDSSQLWRLREWIDSQGEHPSVRRERMNLLVPHDRELAALRDAGGGGFSAARKLVNQSDVFSDIAKKIELLGNPTPLQEAYRHASAMSQVLRFNETALKDSPLNDFCRLMEDDLGRVAGQHLKRMTYLMAVTWKVIRNDHRSTLGLARMFFERLNQRRRRAPSRK